MELYSCGNERLSISMKQEEVKLKYVQLKISVALELHRVELVCRKMYGSTFSV